MIPLQFRIYSIQPIYESWRWSLAKGITIGEGLDWSLRTQKNIGPFVTFQAATLQQLGCKWTWALVAWVHQQPPEWFPCCQDNQWKLGQKTSLDLAAIFPNSHQNPAAGHIQHHGKSSMTPESVNLSRVGFK